jgi:hypothetical protein
VADEGEEIVGHGTKHRLVRQKLGRQASDRFRIAANLGAGIKKAPLAGCQRCLRVFHAWYVEFRST